MSARDTPAADTIVTLRIDLVDSDPPIWREVEVPVSMTLKQIHAVVQAAMGWEDYHLWEFAAGYERISASRAAKIQLHALRGPDKTTLAYLYDFGDSWEHRLTFAKLRTADLRLAYPRYVAGEHAAPPEDSGGIFGFYAQLDILADPNHPDHDEIAEWFGDYDPGKFNDQPIKDRLVRIANRRRLSSKSQKAR